MKGTSPYTGPHCRSTFDTDLSADAARTTPCSSIRSYPRMLNIRGHRSICLRMMLSLRPSPPRRLRPSQATRRKDTVEPSAAEPLGRDDASEQEILFQEGEAGLTLEGETRVGGRPAWPTHRLPAWPPHMLHAESVWIEFNCQDPKAAGHRFATQLLCPCIGCMQI